MSSSQHQIEFGKKFLDAVKEQNVDLIRNYISKGAPFHTDWIGYSALHYVAINGNFEIGNLLLRVGCSIKSTSKLNKTPLHLACEYGHLDIVKLFMKYNAKLDSKDVLNMTPLHWAIERNHVDIVRYLCENYDFNYETVDKFNRSVFTIAQNQLNCDEIMTILNENRFKIKQNSNERVLIKKYFTKAQPSTKSLLVSKITSKNKTKKSKKIDIDIDTEVIELEKEINKTFTEVMDTETTSATTSKSLVVENQPMFDDDLNDSSDDYIEKLTETYLDNDSYWLHNPFNVNKVPSLDVFDGLVDGGKLLYLTEAGKLTLDSLDDTKSANNLFRKVAKSFEANFESINEMPSTSNSTNTQNNTHHSNGNNDNEVDSEDSLDLILSQVIKKCKFSSQTNN